MSFIMHFTMIIFQVRLLETRINMHLLACAYVTDSFAYAALCKRRYEYIHTRRCSYAMARPLSRALSDRG